MPRHNKWTWRTIGALWCCFVAIGGHSHTIVTLWCCFVAMDGHWPTICSLWCCFVAMDVHWHIIILFAFSCCFGASQCFVIGALVDESNCFFSKYHFENSHEALQPCVGISLLKAHIDVNTMSVANVGGMVMLLMCMLGCAESCVELLERDVLLGM